MKNKLLYIVNPASGVRNKRVLSGMLLRETDKEVFSPELCFTRYPGHARELALAAASEGYYAAIAVGGDGTVNEVAEGLIHSQTSLGIVQGGSGNGLALHLGIPNSPKKAVACINRHSRKLIDTGRLNGRFFCNLAGAGFDGEVAQRFSRHRLRGLLPYVKTIIGLYPGYKEAEIQFADTKGKYHRKAILIAFANSDQFGNMARLAPMASTHDGNLDVCILKKIPVQALPITLYRLFAGSLQRSAYTEYRLTKQMVVCSDRPLLWHTDGEPAGIANRFECTIDPSSLYVLVPPTAP